MYVGIGVGMYVAVCLSDMYLHLVPGTYVLGTLCSKRGKELPTT